MKLRQAARLNKLAHRRCRGTDLVPRLAAGLNKFAHRRFRGPCFVLHRLVCGSLCQARGLGMLGYPKHLYLIYDHMSLSVLPNRVRGVRTSGISTTVYLDPIYFH